MYTGFLPSKNGWPFENKWPDNWVKANIQIFGFPVPIPMRGDFGLCGGMCWSALDQYFANMPMPKVAEAPPPGDPLFNEIVQRQTDSVLKTGMWYKVIDYQKRPDSNIWYRENSLQYMVSHIEFPKLKDNIEKNIPTTICLIRSNGLFSNPSWNHQVVAYGYDYINTSGEIIISIYDPNYPKDDTIKLSMNFSNDTLMLEQNSGEPLRGFFVVPYDNKTIPPEYTEEFQPAG